MGVPPQNTKFSLALYQWVIQHISLKKKSKNHSSRSADLRGSPNKNGDDRTALDIRMLLYSWTNVWLQKENGEKPSQGWVFRADRLGFFSVGYWNWQVNFWTGGWGTCVICWSRGHLVQTCITKCNEGRFLFYFASCAKCNCTSFQLDLCI